MKWPEDLRKAISSGAVLLIIGRCRIAYEGRAASRLGEGERIVIIKRDRSVLVHRPTGHEPVNWQPSGSKIEFAEMGSAKTLRASRGHELLEITFTEDPMVLVFYLTDEAEFAMYASEAEMKTAVLLEPSLVEEGFVPLEEERVVGRSGKVDIFGKDRDGNLTVVELKRKTATPEDVKQLRNYVESLASEFGKKPRAILAAPSASKSAISLLKHAGIEFRCITPRACHEVLRKKQGLDAHL